MQGSLPHRAADPESRRGAVGLDRFNNWAALSPQDEKDRRERWLDAFQAGERDYPGFQRGGR